MKLMLLCRKKRINLPGRYDQIDQNCFAGTRILEIKASVPNQTDESLIQSSNPFESLETRVEERYSLPRIYFSKEFHAIMLVYWETMWFGA